MKRSGGVKVFAIFFILTGGFWAWSATIQLVDGLMGWHEKHLHVDPSQIGTGESQIPREYIDQFSAFLKQRTLLVQEFMRAPIHRLVFLTNSLLGVLTFLGGVGILLGKNWARSFIVWQAGLGILFAPWLILLRRLLEHRLQEAPTGYELVGRTYDPVSAQQ